MKKKFMFLAVLVFASLVALAQSYTTERHFIIKSGKAQLKNYTAQIELEQDINANDCVIFTLPYETNLNLYISKKDKNTIEIKSQTHPVGTFDYVVIQKDISVIDIRKNR